MENLFNTVWLLFVLGFGIAGMYVFYYLVYGLPFILWYKLAGAPASSESLMSVSSVPAMLASETVFEYVRSLPNESKKTAYIKILDSIKRLLMEMGKRPKSYPANQVSFALGQLKSQISHSTVAGCLESTRFRRLAATFIESELNKEVIC